ncbi:formyl transferase [Enterovirga sp.]|uniref:glucosamine inositolphosphorylceramide transferase family protein n=1 Tax=Enterovirga sp. TaxID=2026350 RepID=UPI002D1F9E3C|nr:formyl transferase [Enterovirga sp.]
MRRSMHVRVRFDGRAPRLWHARLVERLARMPGLRVDVDVRPGGEPWPANADLLFRLESLLNRLPGSKVSAPLPAGALAALPRAGDDIPDLVLDICGDVPPAAGGRVWRLSFDGRPGEVGLLAGLLAGDVPVAVLTEGGAVVASGRPGSEVPGCLPIAFEDILMRTATLIVAALSTPGARPAGPVGRAGAPGPHLTMPRLAVLTGRMLVRAIVTRLYRLCFRTPHWRIGWRRLDGPGLIDLRALPPVQWHRLADDGRRFYADPFPIVHRGETWLFVEDFVHAVGKGVVSALRFGPDGPVGRPEPVLEEPHHLSYPFLFEREGAVWMIPESGGAGTIDLYRARNFPGGWEKVTTLVSGIVASDATLVEEGGRWWMFVTVRDGPPAAPLGSGSYSDALHLWSAPDFRGPWTPHPRNPVLIDIASARPAGAIVRRGGALIRPVQDCTRGYGHGLALARIDRLDEEDYAQTVETVFMPGPAWPGTRLHTLNSAGGLEFIDGSARARRLG